MLLDRITEEHQDDHLATHVIPPDGCPEIFSAVQENRGQLRAFGLPALRRTARSARFLAP
jgi:hypothetical protein